MSRIRPETYSDYAAPEKTEVAAYETVNYHELMKHIRIVLHDYYHRPNWDEFGGHKFMFNLYCKNFDVEIAEFEKELPELQKLSESEVFNLIVESTVALETLPTAEQAYNWKSNLIKWIEHGGN